jgi:hypothetical protein
MKKLAIILISIIAISCEEGIQHNTTLNDQWYFAAYFPVHTRFVIDKTKAGYDIPDDIFLNYYSILPVHAYKNTTTITGATEHGFSEISIIGATYQMTFLKGVIRADNPFFMDVERVEFEIKALALKVGFFMPNTKLKSLT